MKYIFYLAVLAFLYRAFFSPKVVVEHRHFDDKKNRPDKKRPDAEWTDYEEIK